jgi:hypothetical protein
MFQNSSLSLISFGP